MIWTLFWALVAAAVAGCLVWFGVHESTDPRFALRSVDVSGMRRTTPEQILGAAAMERGANIWLMDIGGAVARIEQNPWVKSASVQRAWPNHVRIQVVERVPIARVRLGISAEEPAGSTGYAIVDRDLRVLAAGPLADADRALPVLVLSPIPSQAATAGADLALTDAQPALQAQQHLARLGVRCSQVAVDPVDGISAVIDSGLRVLLGSLDNLDVKIRVARTIESRMLDLRNVRYVDVRSTAAPTVIYK